MLAYKACGNKLLVDISYYMSGKPTLLECLKSGNDLITRFPQIRSLVSN